MRLRDFVGIIRELSFTEIRHEAMIPPHILLLAPSGEMGTTWRDHLFGADSSPYVDVIAGDGTGIDPLAYDVIISIGRLDTKSARSWADLFRRADEEMALVEIEPAQSTRDDSLHWLRRKVCDVRRDRTVAFGRYIPPMRAAATSEIVSDTSRVNAQFAALSNIPALVPVFGTMLAAGADFIVLTKNQLMMMYRTAAIYERDLDNKWRIYSELMPVVGAGLMWRTVARQAAAILPFALGAVPKVTIAYVGTFAVGRAACVYYEHGEKLSGEQLEEVYREALDRFRSVRHRIIRESVEEGAEPAALTAATETANQQRAG